MEYVFNNDWFSWYDHRKEEAKSVLVEVSFAKVIKTKLEDKII